MGREIRRVPPNWEHPRTLCRHSPWNGGCEDAKKHGGFCYQPMRDEDYETAAEKWLADFDKWRAGELQSEDCKYFWDYDPPPDQETYRPKFIEEPTWYQVYETVSEGTPVTPPFATQEELIEYLCTHGTFWDKGVPWKRESAERFVRDTGWAPSMVVVDGEVRQGQDW